MSLHWWELGIRAFPAGHVSRPQTSNAKPVVVPGRSHACMDSTVGGGLERNEMPLGLREDCNQI